MLTMFRLHSVVASLLLLCLCVRANYVPIGTQIVDLGKKVTEELTQQIKGGLESADTSLQTLEPSLKKCLGKIETLRVECSHCISNSCQQRVTRLQCPSVTVSDVAKCSVSGPLCAIEKTIQGIGATKLTIVKGLKIVADKLLALANKVVKEAAKIINNVAQKVESGLSDAAESVKTAAEKTVNTVVNAAEEVASKVEDAANKVAEGLNTAINKAEELAKKAGKVIESGAKEVANTVQDGAEAVVNFVKNLGRRRRLAAQPMCDDFAQDDVACLFYQAVCDNCTVFGTNEAQSSTRDLITTVCGASTLKEYDDLLSLISRVDSLADVADDFDLTAVKFNPRSLVNELYEDVQIAFRDSIKNYTMILNEPLTPFNIQTAGPTIANAIFKKLFP